MNKRLILLGGGHAHVHVLKSLAEAPLTGCDVTLVSPHPHAIYSGMLPGWVAGHYELDQLRISLAALAAAANVTFHQTVCKRLDLVTQTVICGGGALSESRGGKALPFDMLSIDTGSVVDLSAIPGAVEHAISIRPIEKFVDAFQRMREWVATRGRTRIAIVGAGAGGIELAFAMQHAFRKQDVGITLISGANTLPGHVGPRVARMLRRRGINIMAGQMAARIGEQEVHLQSGGLVAADFVFIATGASAAPWLKESGLFTDRAGYILTNHHLQSVSHGHVFAAGDCATIEHHERPKSGVYAVRAGPPLAENLRRYVRGELPAPYVPQKRSLYLISTGRRHAIGSWGDWSWQGWWVWWWKDWIDRRFVKTYVPAKLPAPVGDAPPGRI